MDSKNVTNWELERYILGDLPPHKREQIERIAKEDPDIQRRIEELKKNNLDILQQYPSEKMAPKIMERVEKGRKMRTSWIRSLLSSKRRFLYITPAIASALLLLFIVLSVNRQPSEMSPLKDSRYKGVEDVALAGPRIIILKKAGDSAEELKSGGVVRSGDLVQIAYIPERMRFGVIFSIDGRGVVTLHFPEDGNASTALEPETRKLLETSFELDDAPEFERFFFISSMEEVDVETLLKQAKVLASSSDRGKEGELALPDTFNQFSILLLKGEGQ